MRDTHGDGEELPVTDLEILRLLLPQDCEHCGGLLLLDADDPGHSKCSECSRNPEPPLVQPVYVSEGQPVYVSEGQPVYGLTAKAGRRDMELAQGAVSPIVRRFIR